MLIRECALRTTIICLAWCCAAGAEDRGVIKGTVKWRAEQKPRREPVQMNSDPSCALMRRHQPLFSERLVVNANDTVKNVFVYVKGGLPQQRKWAVPRTAAVLDQRGCRYEPHVFGIMAGQKLIIRNSDRTLHNINCNPKHNEGFNKAQPMPGLKYEHVFHHPEFMIQLKCNVHPWMTAYCAVMEHPFFDVTNNKGRFEIKGLPPGEYVLATWHEDERLKPQEIKVVLDADETKDDVAFVYE